MSTAGAHQQPQSRSRRKTRLELLAERESDDVTQGARIGGVGTRSDPPKVLGAHQQTSGRAVFPPSPIAISLGEQDGPNVQPVALSVESAARAIGLSRTTVWELVRRGDLPAKRLGNRVMLRVSDLAAFVEALPDYVDGSSNEL